MPPTLYEKGNLIRQDWYKDTQEELDQIRPIDYVIKWMDERKSPRSMADRLLLLKAMTASGKSTVAPSELFHNFYGNYTADDKRKPRSICVTQPRAFNAVDIPSNQVAPFNSRAFLDKTGHTDRVELILGDNIGYQTGVMTFKPVRGLVFMTIGVLLQQMKIMTDEELMEKYMIIIIDEVHERSTDTDLVLLKLKGFLERNWKEEKCPWVILTSATFDPFKFGKYYMPEVKNIMNIIEVSGKSFPIEEHFMEHNSNDFINDAIQKVKYIHEKFQDDFKSTFRDILIFCAGSDDITTLKQKIMELNKKDKFFIKNLVLPVGLTSNIFAEQGKDYWDILNPIEKVKLDGKNITRRIILGTNVAETGITIDTLRHVIDIGYHQSSEFNHTFSCSILIKKPITLDSATQRKGRVGRKEVGDWWPIYTKETFEHMIKTKYPDMITADVTLNLLDVIITNFEFTPTKDLRELFDKEYDKVVKEKFSSYEIRDLFKMDLMSLPSADSMHYSLEKLYVLDAITSETIPTQLGILISKFRKLSIENIRMILSGYYWKICIYDLIVMACIDISKMTKRNWSKNKEKFFLYGVEKRLIPTYKRAISILTLLGDDFLLGLMVYKKIMEIENLNLKLSSEDKNLETDFYLEFGINYNEFLKNLALINDVVLNMMSIGLNPYMYFKKSLGFHSFATEKERRLIKYIELQIMETNPQIALPENNNQSGMQNKNQNENFQLSFWIDTLIKNYESIKSFETITELTENYEDIGTAELINTMNIYSEPIINKVILYKLCIFEGFKLNIASFNKKEYKILTQYTHFPVNIKSDYRTLQPQTMIYDNVFVRYDQSSEIYKGEIAKISIMDGFVPIDRKFLMMYQQ